MIIIFYLFFLFVSSFACVYEYVGATLTVHGHAHCNTLLEAAELTLVAGNLVDDAAAIVLTGVGGVEVLLNGPTEETLETHSKGGMDGVTVIDI